MQPPTLEIFRWNLDRMQQHRGAEFVCAQCGSLGIVGEDLQAATTIFMNRNFSSWWVHESCAEEYMGKFPPSPD